MIATCHVTKDFIENLLNDVECKIAKTSYKDLQNRKFGFNRVIKKREEYNKLIDYRDVLDNVLHCSDCLCDTSFVTEIKNELNGL